MKSRAYEVNAEKADITATGEPSRDKWGSKVDFILSCLGYAVGLGNVWRFPYLCGRNGGAAFMIPYVIMMIFAGFPTFYMELAIGQYTGLTPHILYRHMCPIFTGIGYAMITISFFTGIYYNMIMAWSLYYFGVSFTSNLPWSSCGNSWNTENCFDDKLAAVCQANKTVYWAGRCLPESSVNATMAEYINETLYGENQTRLTAPEEYLNNQVLGISEGLHDLGEPRWQLVLCLFVAWILVFACLSKGIKTSGKVVYFTATFPYVILLILFFRGVTLEGAGDGVLFYMWPNVSRLADGKVWGDAAQQIFFSLSLGGGGLTTLATYNQFNNNLLRDTLIVVLGNCGTSLFAGFVIFPILGFVAKQQYPNIADPRMRVNEVAKSGPSLAFIAYPDALARLPGAPFWSVLFFFMLILLGIDSQLVIVEVVITAVLDQWPSLRPWKRKLCVVFLVCTVSFLIGLVLTCPGGPYVLNVVDSFAGGWTLVIACLTEVIMVSWVYGWRRFVDDIRMMLGAPPSKFWRVLGYPVNMYWIANWVVITPLLLTAALIFTWATYERMTYGDYTYTDAGEAFGWIVAMLCILWIPFMAIYMVITYLIKKKDLKELVEPSPEWGPQDASARQKIDNAYPMGNVPPAYNNPVFTTSAVRPTDSGRIDAVGPPSASDPRLRSYISNPGAPHGLP